MERQRARVSVKSACLLLLLTGIAVLLVACGPDGCDSLLLPNRYDLDDDGYSGTRESGSQPPNGGVGTVPSGAEDQPVLAVGNTLAVGNGGTEPEWVAAKPMVVTKIDTYHWNDGKGATPGTIALKSSDGRTYGPWQASGLPGQNNVPNATWVVTPNETVPAGTYRVVDSDPDSWSQNAESNGVGFANVYAHPK